MPLVSFGTFREQPAHGTAFKLLLTMALRALGCAEVFDALASRKNRVNLSREFRLTSSTAWLNFDSRGTYSHTTFIKFLFGKCKRRGCTRARRK